MNEPATYRVVVNHEEQYAIWPTRLTVPSGWREAGVEGDKEECLAHVDTVWTDMRPRSVRQAMASESPSPEVAP